MAEIALKILDGSGYEDGDCLCAFNRRRIRCVHAEHLCLPKRNGRLVGMDGNGIMPRGHLAQDWCESTSEKRFERLNRSEAQVVRIGDGATIRFRSDEPFEDFDGRIVSVDIERLVRHLRRAQQFPVFGRLDQEVVYGGRFVPDVDRVWQAIHAKTPHRDTDEKFRFWPAGDQDLRSHLFLPVDDFDEVEAERLVRPIVDETAPNAPVVKKRAVRAANWRSIVARLGTTEADVINRGKAVDKRKDVEPFKDRTLLHDKTTGKEVPNKGRGQ